MRWTLRIGFLLLVAWFVFIVSPFVALYGLAQAVKARDLVAIARRVDFEALRGSLTKQLVDEYLKAVGRSRELTPTNRNLAAGAGMTLADPLVAQLVTPESLFDLLEDGWPEKVAGTKPAEVAAFELNLDFASVGRAVRLFAASESRGFSKIYIPLPEDRRPDQRFTLYLRLSGTTWRLMGVELPAALRQRLIKDLPRGNA